MNIAASGGTPMVADTSTRTVQFRIKRQNGPDQPPRWERFSIPVPGGANVISCLQWIAANPTTADGAPTTPVVFDAGCLEEVCGACTMLINGQVRQSCSCLIDDYARSDGESHVEELELSQHPELGDLQPLQGLRLRQPRSQEPPPTFHNAPQRQWVVIVEGRADVGLGDGSVHHFQKGDPILFEDTTGHGHTIQWPEPSILTVMPLAQQ